MADKKRIVFIVNPVSGTSGKNFVLRLIEDYLDKSQYDYEVMKTEYVGHATELAKQASKIDNSATSALCKKYVPNGNPKRITDIESSKDLFEKLQEIINKGESK